MRFHKVAHVAKYMLFAEWRDALGGGRVPQQVAERYLKIRSGVWGPLCKVPGFRDRLVADSSFMVKVGIEVGIGICTKVWALLRGVEHQD